MARVFLLLGLCICAALCSAQTTLYGALADDLRSHYKLAKLVYSDSSLSFYHSLSHLAKRGMVTGFLNGKRVMMKFSKPDLRFIDKMMVKQKPQKWPDTLFMNAVAVTSDSLLSIFGDSNKGHPYFEKNFSNYYFYISKPVYTRNRETVIFRTLEMLHPSAGYAMLSVYQYHDGGWRLTMRIEEGAF